MIEKKYFILLVLATSMTGEMIQIIQPIEKEINGKKELTIIGLNDRCEIFSATFDENEKKIETKGIPFQNEPTLNNRSEKYICIGNSFRMSKTTIIPAITQERSIFSNLTRTDVGFITIDQTGEKKYTKISPFGHWKEVKKISHLTVQNKHYIVSSSQSPNIKFTPIKYGILNEKDVFQWKNCYLIDIIKDEVFFFYIPEKPFFHIKLNAYS
jgi:hypothetical protein